MSYFKQINDVKNVVYDKGPQGRDRDRVTCPQDHQDPQGQAYGGAEVNAKNIEVSIDFKRYLAKNKEKPNVVPINATAYRRIYDDYLSEDRRYSNIIKQIGGESHYPGCSEHQY